MDKAPSYKPYIVGICGGSASGKTFLLNQLFSHFNPEQITLVSQDNYYKELKNQKIDEEGLVNFDHPDSLRMDDLYADMKRLMKGETLEIDEYSFNNPSHVSKKVTMIPAPVIVLEGLLIFTHIGLAKLVDLKIFVDADEHIKLARRLRRDHQERGYSVESILRDYEKFIAPMYDQYVAPAKKNADLIIPNNKHMYRAIQVLVNHIKTVIGEKK